MPQQLVNVRVRPPRVAALVSREAGAVALSVAVTLLSRIWGGRFASLLPVDPAGCDPLTRFRLSEAAPEVIYGVGLDDAHWQQAVREACQPRLFVPLSVASGGTPPDHLRTLLTSVNAPLIHLMRGADRRAADRSRLMLVEPPDAEPFAALVRATYGVHHPNLREEFRDGVVTARPDTAAALVDVATGFVREWHCSWLDVTAHQLGRHYYHGGPIAPTVVLVGDVVSDTALFWNLRGATTADYPSGVIAIPQASAADDATLQALARWLTSRREAGDGFNFCEVTSQSVARDACVAFAARLKAVLAGGPVLAVDYRRPTNRLPVVVGVEYESVWQLDRRRRRLRFLLPTPRAFDGADSHRAWVVELQMETRSGRAVLNAVFPPRSLVPELLNAAAPPWLPGSFTVAPFGGGTSGITVWGSQIDKVVNLQVPSGRELAEEVFHDLGLEPKPDEKRRVYLPAIRKFGGLWLAAKAFSGTSLRVLMAMADGPKTVAQIKSACRLGGGVLPGKTALEEIEPMLARSPARVQRVSRRRWTMHSRHDTPGDLTPATVLEFWADRGVLVRQWRVGPCGRCGQRSFMARLRIDRPVRCPVCGGRLALKESVMLGYDLHPTIRLAVREGLVPVALAARFLYRLGHHGFLWTPGVKYTEDGSDGDIDLVACCDGTMMFCECKDMAGVRVEAEAWREVRDQFIRTMKIAVRCGRAVAVLASRVAAYPSGFAEAVSRECPGVPTLLLTATDLDTGHRSRSDPRRWSRLSIDELQPTEFPEPECVHPQDGIHRTGSQLW